MVTWLGGGSGDTEGGGVDATHETEILSLKKSLEDQGMGCNDHSKFYIAITDQPVTCL